MNVSPLFSRSAFADDAVNILDLCSKAESGNSLTEADRMVLARTAPWSITALVCEILGRAFPSIQSWYHGKLEERFISLYQSDPLPSEYNMARQRLRWMLPDQSEAVRQEWARHLIRSGLKVVKLAHLIETEEGERLKGLALDQSDAIRRGIDNLFTRAPNEVSPLNRRLLFPVTPEQLQKEFDLLKLWALFDDSVEEPFERQPLREAMPPNCLEELADEDGVTVAYYKVNPSRTSAQAMMERCVWDAAVILGIEDQFAPTKIVPRSLERSKAKGSIQPALDGSLLTDLIQDRAPLPSRQEVLRAMVTTLLFGMTDAHSDNIMVNERKFQFFDNARSFVESNGVYFYVKEIEPSIRTGLLELDACYEPLTQADRDYLKRRLIEIGRHLSDLYAYFNHPLTLKRFSRLPKNWMDPVSVAEAMRQRMDRMQRAASTDSLATVRDLAFAVHPEFRFAAAMSLTMDTDPGADAGIVNHWQEFKEEPSHRDKLMLNLQKGMLHNMGGDGYSLEVILCENSRIDPALVNEWCEDTSLSFEEILTRIGAHIQLDLETPPKEWHRHGREIYCQFSTTAALDFKECYEV